MTDRHDRNELDDLRASLVMLSDRVTDILLRGDTVRALLVEQGLISQADFELEVRERHTLWSNRMYYIGAPKREAERIAQRRLRLAAIKPAQE